MGTDARETAGTTMALIISYVREHAGDVGVTRLLDTARETRPLELLEDEHNWSTYEQKIAFFEAACIVLDDPDAMLHIGETAMQRQIGPGIGMLLMRLGSPRIVLANVAKTCPKFTTVATMTAEHLDKEHAVITYRLHEGKVPHRGDCQLNIGLMRTIGPVFGMPPLEIEHPECQVEGAPLCRYIVHWPRRRSPRAKRHDRDHTLSLQVDALTAQIELLQSTTVDLVSSDDIDEVLHRIVTRAGRAVSATGYVLALADGTIADALVYADGDVDPDLERVRIDMLEAPVGANRGRIVIEVASSRRVYGRLAAFYEDHTFFAHEEELLAAYARSAAVALDAATALESARRRGAATAALLGLARSLAEPATPHRIARIVACAMPEILGVDASAVLLWDHETEALRVAGHSGWSKEVHHLVAGFEVRTAESDGLRDLLAAPAPTVMRLDRPQLGPIASRLRALQVPALAIAPIQAHRAGFFGVAIAPMSTVDDRRMDEIVERLSAVADHAATAIQNATLIEEIRHQAVHDTLTGLANRALADDELEKAIARATRSATPLSLLFIDLDDFKAVNDRFGHGAGDHVLKTIAARLIEAGRKGDSVARRGGDEFTLMLPEATREDAQRIAERLRMVISHPISIGGELVAVHASIGVATAPDDGEDCATIVRAADRAMYRNKETNRVMCSVSPQLGTEDHRSPAL